MAAVVVTPKAVMATVGRPPSSRRWLAVAPASAIPQIAAAALLSTPRRIGFMPMMSVIVLTITMSRVPT